MFHFTESLSSNRIPGADGHLGKGLTAERVIQDWVARSNQAQVFLDGQTTRSALSEADRATYVRMQGDHAAEGNVAQALAAARAALAEQIAVVN
jgi:hypothetical protein